MCQASMSIGHKMFLGYVLLLVTMLFFQLCGKIECQGDETLEKCITSIR